VLVTPQVEATINVSTDVNEDTLTKVNFDVVQQNGETGETVDTVWIRVDEVDTHESTFYLGNSTNTPLATSGMPVETIDGNDYYKLTMIEYDNLYVIYSSDLGTTTHNLAIKYQVSDTLSGLSDGNPVSVIDSTIKDANYVINLHAVTDGIIIDATAAPTANVDVANDVVTINGTGDFTANVVFEPLVTMDNNNPDFDGSETVTRFVVENVPQGITVDGGVMAISPSGQTLWFVDIPDEILDGVDDNYTLTFSVKDELAIGTGNTNEITITAFNEDGSGSEVETATTTLTFVDNMNNLPGSGGSYIPIQSNLSIKPFDVVEDSEFSLLDIASVTPDANYNTAVYSIAFKNLDHVTVKDPDALTTFTENGETVYVLQVTGDQNAINTALDAIKLVPESNFNVNNANGEALSIDVSLTAYVPDTSNISNAQDDFTDADVTPVTDAVDTSETITTDSPNTIDTLEDGEYQIDLNISTVDDLGAIGPDNDGSDFTFVQGLSGGAQTSISFSHTSGIDGTLLWDGGSVDLSQSGITTADVPVDKLDSLSFKPFSDKAGSVTLSYDVYTQETGASNIAMGTGSMTFDVKPVADGLALPDLDGNDLEDSFVEIKADFGLGTSLDNAVLADVDGSETITTLLIDGVPDGFLVFVGNAHQDQAQNAGDNGVYDVNDANTGFDLAGTVVGLIPGTLMSVQVCHRCGLRLLIIGVAD